MTRTPSTKPTTPATASRRDQPVDVRRLPVRFVGDDHRVITRPFMTTAGYRIRPLFERIDTMDEAVIKEHLAAVISDYTRRHNGIESIFREHYEEAMRQIGFDAEWSDARRLLAGAYLTMEYAIEAAALFNPAIVPHPDQTNVPSGGLRFLMSLRATGEGHISSIVFRTGTIKPDEQVIVDPPASTLSRSRMSPDRRYLKPIFRRKLKDMAAVGPAVDAVLDALPDEFTMTQLHEAVEHCREMVAGTHGASERIDMVLWLAQSNYHVDLPPDADVSELVIFPMSDAEARGIEDLRLVCFTEDDGSHRYIGTYTAYNGMQILPMLLETSNFRHYEVHSLNGRCARDKGMALFPRRIGGHYVMCSRIDGENLFISYSDHIHFWESADFLAAPAEPWEAMHIGNCGSPIETDEGWLLITHGVGPMRTYAIGAMLLDLDDPLKVRGRLRQPLIRPMPDEREGYVPNVVYTCGALEHQGCLYLPYAAADKASRIAVADMDELINRLLDSPPR